MVKVEEVDLGASRLWGRKAVRSPPVFSELQRDGGSCCDSVPQFRSGQTGVESGVDKVGARVGTWLLAGVS